jgi:fatty-acyl-CoA synthase
LPGIRYASVVAVPTARRWVATLVGWTGTSVDRQACHHAVGAAHGAAVVEAMTWLTVGRLPLTEQGKPDRAAIIRLAGVAS